MDEQRLRESKSRAIKVLIGCILLSAFCYGTVSALSIYVPPICERLGAEATQVTFFFSITSVCAMAAGLAAAALLERLDPRVIMLVGVAGFTAFFLCLRFADSLLWVYAGAVGMGLSQVFVGTVIAQPIVLWWHAKDTGKKISYLTIASFVATMILAPGIAVMLEKAGFGTTVLANGLALGALMLLAVVFLISGKPEKYGLKPYGYEESAQEEASQEEYVPSGLTFKQALRTPSFWAVLIAAALVMVPANGFLTNQALVYQSVGFDSVFSGTLISVFSGASIVWCFLYGFLSDKFGPRVANVAFSIGSICAMLGFVVIGGKIGAVFIVLTFGMASSYSGMLGAVTFSSLFGTRAIGSLIPVVMVAGFLGAAAGPPIAAAVNAATGSYTAFMLVSVAIIGVVLVLLTFATSKRSVAKIKAMEEAGE